MGSAGFGAVAILLSASTSFAQGISARFGDDPAIIGRDVELRVEVDDPLGIAAAVEIDLRRPTGPWWTQRAVRTAPGHRWWTATFSSTAVWPSVEPGQLEARARIYGRRGGILLVLGDLEPVEIPAISGAEARRRAEILASGEPSRFAGYVGALTRLNSSARARAYLGFGGMATPRVELIGVVSLGPAFDRPKATGGGGPILLGGEAAARLYTRPLRAHEWNLFVTPFAGADVRFPGLDAGAGVRIGIGWRLKNEVSLEAMLGGAAVRFGLVATDDDRPKFGFVGGVRIGVRLGAARRSRTAGVTTSRAGRATSLAAGPGAAVSGIGGGR